MYGFADNRTSSAGAIYNVKKCFTNVNINKSDDKRPYVATENTDVLRVSRVHSTDEASLWTTYQLVITAMLTYASSARLITPESIYLSQWLQQIRSSQSAGLCRPLLGKWQELFEPIIRDNNHVLHKFLPSKVRQGKGKCGFV